MNDENQLKLTRATSNSQNYSAQRHPLESTPGWKNSETNQIQNNFKNDVRLRAHEKKKCNKQPSSHQEADTLNVKTKLNIEKITQLMKRYTSSEKHQRKVRFRAHRRNATKRTAKQPFKSLIYLTKCGISMNMSENQGKFQDENTEQQNGVETSETVNDSCENLQQTSFNHNTEESNENVFENCDVIENGRDDASIASRSEQNVVELCFPDTSENQRNTCSHSTTIEHYIRTCVNVDILCPECDDVTPLSGFQNLMHQFTKNDRITKPASKRIEKSFYCGYCKKVFSSAQKQFHVNLHELRKVNLTGVSSSSGSLRKAAEPVKKRGRKKKRNYIANLINSKFMKEPEGSIESESLKEISNLQEQTANSLTSQADLSTDDFISIEESENNKNRRNVVCKESMIRKPKTRAKKVRNMACKMCGQILMSYKIACDHYLLVHGKNVLICQFCSEHFLFSKLLTKHILEKHLENDIPAEPMIVDLTEDDDNQHLDVPNVRANDEKNAESMQETMESQVQPNEFTQTVAQNEVPRNQAHSDIYNTIPNAEDDQKLQPNDEPLNLSIRNISVDIDNIIDPSSGALDLTMKKMNNRPR